MRKQITLDFSVNANTSLGEQVFITGNVVGLGCWNPGYAMKLQTNKQIYPEWKNTRSLSIPPCICLEFKLFIKNSQGLIRWQRLQENRKFVPIESAVINFTQSRMQMIFQEKMYEVQQKVTRKKTHQIILDLSDQFSQSSSGNQKQFWEEKIYREKPILSISKQFIATAKLVHSSWIPQEMKIIYKFQNIGFRNFSSVHYIIKIDKQNKINKEKKIICEEGADNSPSLIYEITSQDKAICLPCLKEFDDKLKIYHIQPNDWSFNSIKLLHQKYQGQFIFYLLNAGQMIKQQLLPFASVLITKRKQILKQILQKYKLSGSIIQLIEQNHFLVKTSQHKFLIVYEPDLLITMTSQLQLESELSQKYNDYFSQIQKIVANQEFFNLSDRLRMSLMIRNNISSQVKKSKFCICILCDKLQQIPQKIKAKLIRISSMQNISVNIMTSDQQEIIKRLPISKSHKFLVYNRNGEVFKPDQKPCNLYQQFHVKHKEFEEIIRKFLHKAAFWINNREIKVFQSMFLLQLTCEINTLGEIISRKLVEQFYKFQSGSKFPLVIQKQYNRERNYVVIKIRPLLSSIQFFNRIVTTLNIINGSKTFFFSFDYTKNKHNFTKKLNRIMSQKKCMFEGFISQEQYDSAEQIGSSKGIPHCRKESAQSQCDSKTGLDNQKLVQFLDSLITLDR